MSEIIDVLDAMDAVLEGITGLRVADYKATNVVPPMAYTTAPATTGDETFDGRWSAVFEIVLLVSAMNPRAAQRQIAAFITNAGTQSIAAAFDANPTLSGKVEDCHVTGFIPFDELVADTIGYLGGKFPVEVML